MTARLVVGFGGLYYLLTGLALLFAPQWFFDTVGHFPPFNRHYLGDLGAFLLPLGIGLLLAAREPVKHHGLAGVVALASLLHALNHIYDSTVGQAPLSQWLTADLPLLVLALLLIWAYRDLAVRDR